MERNVYEYNNCGGNYTIIFIVQRALYGAIVTITCYFHINLVSMRIKLHRIIFHRSVWLGKESRSYCFYKIRREIDIFSSKRLVSIDPTHVKGVRRLFSGVGGNFGVTGKKNIVMKKQPWWWRIGSWNETRGTSVVARSSPLAFVNPFRSANLIKILKPKFINISFF